MRKIQTQDVFSFARLLKELNLKTEVLKLAKGGNEIDGADFIFTIIESVANQKCEQEFYAFLSPIFETEEESIKTMDLEELVKTIKSFFGEGELKSFFIQVQKLMK